MSTKPVAAQLVAAQSGHGVAAQPEDLSAHRGLRNRTIESEFPYLYLDAVILKRSWAGEIRNVSVLVAIGIGADGFRHILGVAEGEKGIWKAGAGSCGI